MSMKPLSFALERNADLTDSAFRLLICLGEYPDGSGRTENCEVSVQRIADMAGPTWSNRMVVMVADELRDQGFPIGVIGGLVCWRPEQ